MGQPSVAFREAITLESENDFKYAKQSGGKGQFARTLLRIEPNEGKGYEFIDKIEAELDVVVDVYPR